MREGSSNVERRSERLTPFDELFLERACELAARAIGNTSPNPPVGAVVVHENRIVGEGYHHRAGGPHAEVFALRQAGARARGGTIYVSLEPCRHVGSTPPCTLAIIDAGVARVVAGTLDPTEHGGAQELRERGIDVVIADDSRAGEMTEIFARSMPLRRPYVALKMASTLDGAIASRPGVREQLTGEAARQYVRDLRTVYDAVMVGAGTVRVDDPLLTVRPPHHRLRPYVRVVACEKDGVSASSRIFGIEAGYAKTIVLAPGALAKRLDTLSGVAEVVGVGSQDADRLDLTAALEALRAHEIYSLLCEGGPTLASALIASGEIDRCCWLFAPRFMRGEDAVSALSEARLPAGMALRFDRVERLGNDALVSGVFERV